VLVIVGVVGLAIPLLPLTVREPRVEPTADTDQTAARHFIDHRLLLPLYRYGPARSATMICIRGLNDAGAYSSGGRKGWRDASVAAFGVMQVRSAEACCRTLGVDGAFEAD
jgi:hypothetical protein